MLPLNFSFMLLYVHGGEIPLNTTVPLYILPKISDVVLPTEFFSLFLIFIRHTA